MTRSGKIITKTIIGLITACRVAAFSPGAASAALSLDECLSIAEANHPNVKGSAASVASARAKLAQSAVSDRADVSGTASVSRSGSYLQDDSYSIGASAGIKLYDANRSKYTLDAARYSLSAAEAEAMTTLSDVRSAVKTAFMTLLLDKWIVSQREESVKAFEKHLEQAKGFYDVGTKPWYDVTKAEVDLGNARMSLAEAEANVLYAKSSLANAMGVDQTEDIDIALSALGILSLDRETESLAGEIALANRADYKASEFKLMGGQASLQAAARTSSPAISLSGGYSGRGDSVSDIEMGWTTGLSLSVPIIDGGAARAAVDSARAQIMSLEASREQLRQDIMLSVNKARTDIIKARERIRLSELTLVSAEENLRLAEGRYETGVGDPLEVTDAIVSFTDAQLTHKQALYDLQVAIINLEKAAGVEFSANDAAGEEVK